MKITIISGSHRPQSQSMKIARVIQSQLSQAPQCEGVDIIDLAENPLPLWEEKIWDNDPEWQARLAPISEGLKASDAFVVICPEWHGMAPAGLKNFFLMWGGGELAHKPALIVTVSSADGGSYPVAELRMSSYKNNRICYLPEHLIIRNVETVFNDNPADNNESAQPYFEDRLSYCLNMLISYGEGFKHIRESGTTDLTVYKSGM